MANEAQLRLLRHGVETWNEWRRQAPGTGIDLRQANLFKANLTGANLLRANLTEADLIEADLRGADLSEAKLGKADLRRASLGGAHLSRANLSRAALSRADLCGANLGGAHLSKADLPGANLRGANLCRAKFSGADLTRADLSRTDLTGADLTWANLFHADLSHANLTGADPSHASLSGANLRRAKLRGADVSGADLSGANLGEANLSGAELSGVTLNDADLSDADLTGCRIYGVSAWGLKLSVGTKQQGLIITPQFEPEITTDDIEVAQFLYLLIHNEKLRKVIDTITSKVVLILGRFSEGRKVILDAVRDALRKRDLLPVIFDFAIPASRDVTETVKVLAGLARFVIADITDATEVRVELHTIVRDFPSLAVQPILLRGQPEFVSVQNLRRFHWLLPSFQYDTTEHLLTNLNEHIVAPAEAKVRELQRPQPPRREPPELTLW
jgi:uncharacterized protein YjbI with pentapeptide repeats